MRVLLCQAVCLATDAVACFAWFAILWRKWVAIPASFEVVEIPDDGGVEGGSVLHPHRRQPPVIRP